MAKQKEAAPEVKELIARPAANVSTYVEDNNDFGDMSQSDIVIPRGAVMQGGSQLVKDGIAIVGSIWDSTQQRILVERDVKGTIIPLVMFKDWIEWNPDRNSPEMIIARSTDANSELAQRARAFEKVIDPLGRERVAVTETYNFFAVFPSAFGLTFEDIANKPELVDECIVWVGFNRTMHKLGKLWLNRMKRLKAPDPRTGEISSARIFAAAWEITTEKKTKGPDDWFVFNIGSYELLPTEAVVVLSAKAAELRSIMDQAIESDTKAGGDFDEEFVVNEDI